MQNTGKSYALYLNMLSITVVIKDRSINQKCLQFFINFFFNSVNFIT